MCTTQGGGLLSAKCSVDSRKYGGNCCTPRSPMLLVLVVRCHVGCMVACMHVMCEFVLAVSFACAFVYYNLCCIEHDIAEWPAEYYIQREFCHDWFFRTWVLRNRIVCKFGAPRLSHLVADETLAFCEHVRWPGRPKRCVLPSDDCQLVPEPMSQ